MSKDIRKPITVETKRYRRVRRMLREAWALMEPYAMRRETEEALVRAIARIEIDLKRSERRHT